MSVLEIVKAGSPVLKQICNPVEKIDAKFKRFLDDMAETMYKANGVGLAAPQVGVPVRAVVIDVGKDSGLLELINPVIIAREGKEIDSEGCLSVPNIFGDVERSAKVTVEYLNRNGRKRRLTAEKLLARCVQHELDHLEGRLFIDIAKALRREEDK